MSHLKVVFFSGQEFEHQLQQSEAVSIGKNESNDITIDGPDVALMHCRIMWKKDAFELTAANLDGVDLNGTLVRQAELKSGDELRIGDADITVYIKDKSAMAEQIDAAVKEPDEFELKPLTDDELLVPLKPEPEKPKKKPKKKRRKSPRKEKGNGSAFPNDFFDDDDDDGTPYTLEGSSAEEDSPEETKKRKKEKKEPVLKRMGGSSVAEGETGEVSSEAVAVAVGAEGAEKSQSSGISMLKNKLKPKPMRPGERDTARSPVVLTLGGGALFLTLASVAIWLLIGRTNAFNDYNIALQDKEDKKYAQAISRLEKFPVKFPGDALKQDAQYALSQSRVEQHLFSSSSTKWADAVKAVDQFMNVNRDDANYKDHYIELHSYARTISSGSAEDALKGRGLKPPARHELLKISEKAKGWVERFGSEEDETMGDFINQIEVTIEDAKSAIKKQEMFLAAEANINAALANKDPMRAFSLRIGLLNVHPDFAKDRKMTALMNKTLETEQGLIKNEKIDQPAITKEIASTVSKSLSLTFNSGFSSADNSDGRTVISVAQNCCYGLDAVKGTPLWRRKIGLDTPFFPVSVQTDVEAILLFDMNRNELTLLERRTGKLIWSQPIQAVASGEPLIYEGQIYLPTMSNQLWKIDLETGRAFSRLTFSQPVISRPLLVSGGKQLVIAGEKAVLYLLSTLPLECQSVTYMGHNSGAVVAPLIAMGSLVLLPENFGLNRCRLRILKILPKTNRLQEVGVKSIEGLVRDRAVLRGNKLFIPASNEQVYAFTASDEQGQPPLTYLAKGQMPESRDITSYLSTGPDKQLWMGSSALYKLQLKAKEVVPAGQPLAVGTMTQPMQLIGQHYFLGRQSLYGTTIFFTRAEREKMEPSWRIILGCRILSMTTQQGKTGTSLVCLTEAGDGFRISEKDLAQGGFKITPGQPFRYKKETWTNPLGAIPVTSNKLFAYHGGDRPTGWWVNMSGQVEKMSPLSREVQGTPIPLGKGVVLPQKGRLQLFFGRGGRRVVPFAATVVKGKDLRWKFLIPIDETQFLACDNQNHLYRIQYRKTQNLLAKGSVLDLTSPVDVAPAHHQGRVAIADATGMLKMLDVQSLGTVAQKKLPNPATNALWVVGDQLLVETGYNQLTAFQMGKELKQLWSVNFTKSKNGLAGTPLLVGGKILLATRSGEAITLDPQKGTVLKRLYTNESLTSGALRVGQYLIVATLDGSLLRIESVMQSAKKAVPPKKETK